MPKFERLSEADVSKYKAWQALDKAREKLKASISACGLLPESVVIQARTKDGLLVRAGEDQGEVFRHLTPYGPLILDRKRNIAQSPLRPGVNIRLSRNLGPILAKLLENPEALVSRAELYQAKYGEDITYSPSDYNNVGVSIFRLRRLLGEKTAKKDDRQLIFVFHDTLGQSYCSLVPCLPNTRPGGEQEADTQRYIYQHEIPSVGKLVLDANRGIAHSPLKPGQYVKLGPLETRLLAVLMSDPEHVFSSRILFQKVWQDTTGTSFPGDYSTHVKALISQLRVKLGFTSPFRLIYNFGRFGYSLADPKDHPPEL